MVLNLLNKVNHPLVRESPGNPPAHVRSAVFETPPFLPILFAFVFSLFLGSRKRRTLGRAQSLSAHSQRTKEWRYETPHLGPKTPLLDYLTEVELQSSPTESAVDRIKKLPVEELERLSIEMCESLIYTVSKSGGHLSGGLGVVDLSIALHYVFDSPKDRVVWDIGHQGYPHKMLTGRRHRMETIRQEGGISGFLKRNESEHDIFGAGHSGTAISATLGFAEADRLSGVSNHNIAVVGDGGITGGMCYEALNHAGGLNSKMIVILNDNGEVSLPTQYNTPCTEVRAPVGGLSQALKRVKDKFMGDRSQAIIASSAFQSLRKNFKRLTHAFPSEVQEAFAKVDEYSRGFISKDQHISLFEGLGFFCLGPVNGHNLPGLIEILSNIKESHDSGKLDKPVFLHVITRKGKGFDHATNALDTMHGVTQFNVEDGVQEAKRAKVADPTPEVPYPHLKRKTYSQVFGETLASLAAVDPKIVALTAAMPGGTGLTHFKPYDRFYDVGIAEQHCVTFAGGLAAEGYKPFVAIYSTFIQRAYDQIVHDISLQNLPVRFVIDRAGFVGDDGPSHAGSFDTAFLGCLPNMLISASSDENELANLIYTLSCINNSPSVVRVPRGSCSGKLLPPAELEFLEPGRGQVLREGDGKVCILSFGNRLGVVNKVSDELEKEHGIKPTIFNAIWAKPLDEAQILRLARGHDSIITIEEGSIGGFGSYVQDLLAKHDIHKRLRTIKMSDAYIPHAKPERQYVLSGMGPSDIKSTIIECASS